MRIRIKNKKAIMISLICAVSAFAISFIYLLNKAGLVEGYGDRVHVLVAARDIEPNSLLTSDMIKYREVPKTFVQPLTLSDHKLLKGTVSTSLIKKNEQIMLSKIVIAGKSYGLTPKLTLGMRAVSISLDKGDAVGGLVMPDDRVDVYFSAKNKSSLKPDLNTSLMFQDILVLAVNDDVHSFKNPNDIIINKNKKKNLPFNNFSGSGFKQIILTFALPSDDIRTLIDAYKSGYITVALRSPNDRSKINREESESIQYLGRDTEHYLEYRGK